MSPSKFQDDEMTKGVMSGPRPLPLRINKDSHTIQKPVTENSPKYVASAKRQPVIIYTHSPKVIHAQARDFMALVQKLTGMSRADREEKVKSEPAVKEEDSVSDEKEKNIGYGENEITSCVIADERFDQVKQDSCSSTVSPMYKMSSNNYLVDAPLFTPNSNEFFCSSRPNALFQSPNSISPSYMDYMKAFPDY